MKHFMQPQTAIMRKAHSTDPLSTPSPSSAKPRPYRKAKLAKENAPPSDPNSMAYDSKQSPAMAATLKSQLPPRPPSSNPLNRKLIMETVPENSVPGASDSGVQVFLFIKPSFYWEEERAEREAECVVERAEREAERAAERVKRKEERAADRVESDARLEALREEFMAIFSNQSQVYKLVKFMQMSCLMVCL
uniref:Uncharacterized protein n=1 Tax=Fagus sylvatica TaxID=28930 RepID=A0A2N9GHP9_FAGSY